MVEIDRLKQVILCESNVNKRFDHEVDKHMTLECKVSKIHGNEELHNSRQTVNKLLKMQIEYFRLNLSLIETQLPHLAEYFK